MGAGQPELGNKESFSAPLDCAPGFLFEALCIGMYKSGTQHNRSNGLVFYHSTKVRHIPATSALCWKAGRRVVLCILYGKQPANCYDITK